MRAARASADTDASGHRIDSLDAMRGLPGGTADLEAIILALEHAMTRRAQLATGESALTPTAASSGVRHEE